MGLFGKNRRQQLEHLTIQSEQIYLDGMNDVMDPVIAQGKMVSLPAFWHAHQTCAFASASPFGRGAPEWARIWPGEFKQRYWEFAWTTWGHYVVTEGHESWTYPNGKVDRWDGRRVIEG